MSRQIVLDTETTGLEVSAGHRVIELGCVELIERRPTGNNLHLYFRPDREVDAGAAEVHGITTAFLADKPAFADEVDRIADYLRGAELLIHNADFDVGFLDKEFTLCAKDMVLRRDCRVTDTVALARKCWPGQRASLDALCKRLGVDNTRRELHGALLDAQLLAEVYLRMTGGQVTLSLEDEEPLGTGQGQALDAALVQQLRVVVASDAEAQRHQQWLQRMAEQRGEPMIWSQLFDAPDATREPVLSEDA